MSLNLIAVAQLLNLGQVVSVGSWNFNGFDVGVLVILLISLLYAASRGFLREVTSLLALLVAAVITLFIWGQFRFDLQGVISPSWLADAILVGGAGMLSYLLMVFLLSGIGKKIAGKEVGLLDRLLGAGFGVARGLVLCSLLVMVLTSQHRASNEAVQFREYIRTENIPQEMIDKMPKSMRDQMNAAPKPLPTMLEDSTFYPLLNRIADAIRALPFAKMRSYADRIKDGEFEALAEDIDRAGDAR
ncbi:CvpA family protein [Litorimonas sp. RW-G-Af-16]|uniref:CvpA family protein n=1 Tax=Litorimonas sp. RW-G-Af-16 TaxID=3241168 RepID=UPI00390CACD0